MTDALDHERLIDRKTRVIWKITCIDFVQGPICYNNGILLRRKIRKPSGKSTYNSHTIHAFDFYSNCD